MRFAKSWIVSKKREGSDRGAVTILDPETGLDAPAFPLAGHRDRHGPCGGARGSEPQAIGIIAFAQRAGPVCDGVQCARGDDRDSVRHVLSDRGRGTCTRSAVEHPRHRMATPAAGSRGAVARGRSHILDPDLRSCDSSSNNERLCTGDAVSCRRSSDGSSSL